MKCLLALLVLLTLAAPANAQFNGCRKGPCVRTTSTPPVTIPTFTSQSTGGPNSFSTTTAPTWSATIDIGAAFTGRFVVAMWRVVSNATMTAADFNGVSAGFANIGSYASGSYKFALAYGVVNTGTTATLNVSVDDVTFGSTIYIWTCQVSDLLSTTPTTGFNFSTATVPGTATVNVSSSGAVLAYGQLFGGTFTNPTFTTPNDPGVTADHSSTFTVQGTKNNSAAFTPASVSVTAAGTPGDVIVSLATFR